ncbi:MAG: hypothetical protein EOO71_03630 [Myxococcaceae bacterium]|nr:MAG: hypothetical protein EOO71_03630 [Myxococcaceae bacterium]
MKAIKVFTRVRIAALGFAAFLSANAAMAAAPTAPQVSTDAVTCRAGLMALKNDMYRYPARPETAAAAGRESFKIVYARFKATQLAACDRVNTYLKANSTQAVAASASSVMKTDGVASFGDYLQGRGGIVFIGDRILGYCPNLHKSQYDCVSATTQLNATISSGLKILEPLAALECEVEAGWSGCRVVAASSKTVRIYSTPAVSLAAQKAVATVYNTILASLKAPYDASKFDGYKVYITNGEAWSDLKPRPPMGFMGADDQNDELRGGTSPSFLWIEEQMICKKGVATRNAAFAAGKRKQRDDDWRTFDQVVHEFAHAIDFKFNLQPQYGVSIFPGAPNFPAAEDFAWGVQHFFGTPAGSLNPAQNDFLNKLFDKSIANKTPFTCAALMP